MRTLRRRRQEAKTDYRARIVLLKSGKPRLVIRKTNRYIIAQFVVSKIAQDSVVVSVTSKDLLQKGWPKEKAGSLKSFPAAYLTGYLLGKNAKGKIAQSIVDLGLQRNIPKSRLYAVIRGCIDAGISVSCSESVMPTIQEIQGHQSGDLVQKLKDKL